MPGQAGTISKEIPSDAAPQAARASRSSESTRELAIRTPEKTRPSLVLKMGTPKKTAEERSSNFAFKRQEEQEEAEDTPRHEERDPEGLVRDPTAVSQNEFLSKIERTPVQVRTVAELYGALENLERMPFKVELGKQSILPQGYMCPGMDDEYGVPKPPPHNQRLQKMFSRIPTFKSVHSSASKMGGSNCGVQ
ncbi:hypothetical protein CYMTET_25567 [Cymbomonas tetramitiformis]|uniref:Uncharacterized protein n=1 Tax=Cymbomonas tetramitiformis TaxID=36881 RepID=A0AAE0FUA6_9CHLO|nr:hypothetical protein CYMTET_25567 [Cymbomonas tetramitiformis]